MRAALSAAILGGAVSEGLPRTGVLLAVGAGAAVLAFIAASSARRVQLSPTCLLGGTAILGLVFAVLLLTEEEREGRRLYVDWTILRRRPSRLVGPAD